MPSANERETISISALAKRWGFGVERVRSMIRAGMIPGAFAVPSCGRYGKAIRIPLSQVRELEANWRIVPMSANAAPSRRKAAQGRSHFPELTSEPDAESPSDGRD